jgi:beta-glucosidase
MDAAEAADVAVVVVRDVATEGADRSLALPDTQDHLVTAVAAVADRTVVVLNTAGPVEMPWLDAVDAVLATWYPGQADGAALADVLYGDADPGGRLPVTVAAADAYPTADPRRYPGVDGRATYDEGVFVGYRWFDADGPDPTFPFGHGHSYTDFAYTEPTATVDAGPTATLAVTVENTGDRPGRTVVQGYLAPRTTPVPRPPKELAAFESVALSPGESRRVGLSFDRRDFARYDPEAGEWTVDAGAYDLLAAASAGDVRCRERVSVP